jgi:hypothetical protein
MVRVSLRMNTTRLPLPGFPGYTYDPDADREPARGEPSPIYGQKGSPLVTYRPRKGNRACVQLRGSLRPLHSVLPAAPGEEWRSARLLGRCLKVSTQGRVRTELGRVLRPYLVDGLVHYRIGGTLTPLQRILEAAGILETAG